VAVLLDCDMHADALLSNGAMKRKDGRLTGIGSQILRELGVRRLNVLSSPFHLPALSGHDLEIIAFIPLGEADLEGAHAPGAGISSCRTQDEYLRALLRDGARTTA